MQDLHRARQNERLHDALSSLAMSQKPPNRESKDNEQARQSESPAVRKPVPDIEPGEPYHGGKHADERYGEDKEAEKLSGINIVHESSKNSRADWIQSGRVSTFA